MVMAEPNVLDTSALINWPIELLDGGYVVENQKLEVSRVSPDRMLSLEAASLIWKQPTRESIDEATKIARETGDLDGLSETDLALLALVVEFRGHLHTDDYRMQNVCSFSGMKWSSVESVGISGVWEWEMKCKGCGRVTSGIGRTRLASEETGECSECGSELRFRKKA
tara:strand:+ start:921 stop:1424 length:504 start_codon:yes stop_codon:yes gene_type:complete